MLQFNSSKIHNGHVMHLNLFVYKYYVLFDPWLDTCVQNSKFYTPEGHSISWFCQQSLKMADGKRGPYRYCILKHFKKNI